MIIWISTSDNTDLKIIMDLFMHLIMNLIRTHKRYEVKLWEINLKKENVARTRAPSICYKFYYVDLCRIS